jgi:hypothetical protein
MIITHQAYRLKLKLELYPEYVLMYIVIFHMLYSISNLAADVYLENWIFFYMHIHAFLVRKKYIFLQCLYVSTYKLFRKPFESSWLLMLGQIQKKKK